MTRRLRIDRRGGVAIEFALVAPVFLLIVLLLVQGGIALQQWNAMQTVGAMVARCVAIGSPRCTNTSGGTGDPAIDYAIRTAKAQAVGVITANMITIDTISSASGLSYSRVSLSVPVTLLGVTVTLKSVSQVPKP